MYCRRGAPDVRVADRLVAEPDVVADRPREQVHILEHEAEQVAQLLQRPIADLPGLRDALEQFVGCQLITVADGFAAAATSLLDLPQIEPDQAVRLLRRLRR